MRRVVQSRTGETGTCFRACLASILELKESQVPDFKGDDDTYWGMVDEFLSKHGLAYRRVPMHSRPSGYSTIEGVSPRGGLHACVAYDGELVWDPHPIELGDGQGLVEPRYYGLLEPIGGRAEDAKYIKTLYHGTTSSSLKSIRKQGLKPGNEPHVYVSTDPVHASEYAYLAAENKGQPVVLHIDRNHPSVRKMSADPAYAREGVALSRVNFRTPNTIHPDAIKKVVRMKDRADMTQLRKNTTKQGGPFLMQVTEPSGRTHTGPTRNART